MAAASTGKGFFRALLTSAAVIGVIAFGFGPEPASATATATAAVPGRQGHFAGRVGIGNGRSLYVECRGKGSPTVILEAGLRSRSDFWSVALDDTTPRPLVFQGISAFTRVCEYDRPGTTLGTEDFSRSTPVAMPRTAGDAARDLGRLIRKVARKRPVVLVGHSTGGLITRLRATRHPRQVAGLVQVDALSEYLADFLTRNQMRVFDQLNNGPLPGLENYKDLEQIGFRASFRQMRRAQRRHRLRGMPVTVIARGLPTEVPAGLPAGLTGKVLERAWHRSQLRLARLTPNTRYRVGRKSSHYIMFSQPGLIIQAVRRIVRN